MKHGGTVLTKSKYKSIMDIIKKIKADKPLHYHYIIAFTQFIKYLLNTN